MLINFTEAGIYHVGGFMFKPGINEVPDGLWKKGIGDHPHVMARLEKGSLKIIKAMSADKKTEKVARGLSDFEAPQAAELVNETLDHELLVSWMKKEERLSVKTALQAQLRKLDLDDEGKPLSARGKEDK